MQEFVILQYPGLLLLYGAGLLLCLLERAWGATKGIFWFLSAALGIAASAFLIFYGGSLPEAAAYLMVFVLVMWGVKR
ncbi:MAG: hypothetical protein IJ083_10520 [Clostridia bacterium]|nr:hypothetical protein [Clostridia bacterium]